MSSIRVPYKSLTADLDRSVFNNYLLMKSYCQDKTDKPGFIRRNEIESIAKTTGYSRYAFIKKLNNLSNTDLIKKNQYGYTLTSTTKINNRLNLNYQNKKTGIERCPFFKIELTPSTDNHYQLELIKMYYLIKQIHTRYKHWTNATKRIKKQMPESFALSMEKIMLSGKYNNKMTVRRYLNDLEKIGLLKIERGQKITGKYECFKYTLRPVSNVNWSKLNEPTKFEKFIAVLAEKPIKKNKRVSVSTKKAPAVWNQPELAFKKLLNAGLQDILVDQSALGNIYRSFGSKRGRQITKNQLSKCLVHTLNDPELRKIMLSVICPANILVTENANGYHYDTRLNTFHKDRFTFFNFHELVLVESGGNFDEYSDEFLISKEYKQKEIKDRIYA